MARSRNIKPGFFKNPELAEVAFEHRLLFIGLWLLADREGRLENRPKRIRMELFPADDVDVLAGLHALEKVRLIVLYEVGEQSLIWIPEFLKHQKPHYNEAASTLPEYQGSKSVGLDDHPNPPKEAPTREKVARTPADSLIPDSLIPDSSPSGRARATRIPKDWKASEDQLAWAMNTQPTWSGSYAAEVAASFRDYWVAKAGADAAKLDWEATWRNWVRRQGPMRAARGNSGGPDLAERNRIAGEEAERELESRL